MGPRVERQEMLNPNRKKTQLNPPSLELERQAKPARRQTSSNPPPGTPRVSKIAPSKRGTTSLRHCHPIRRTGSRVSPVLEEAITTYGGSSWNFDHQWVLHGYFDACMGSTLNLLSQKLTIFIT